MLKLPMLGSGAVRKFSTLPLLAAVGGLALLTAVLAITACSDCPVHVSNEAHAANLDGGTEYTSLSYVAFVFAETEISDIKNVHGFVHEYDEWIKEPSAKVQTVDGVLVVTMMAPAGQDTYAKFEFLDINGEQVYLESNDGKEAEYSAKFEADRRMITYGGQVFRWDPARPHHVLPEEKQLNIGEVLIPLGNQQTMFVGDRFLRLRGVGYYPNNGGDQSLRVKTGDPMNGYIVSWIPSKGKAIPLGSDNEVNLAGGATLLIGVEAEVETAATITVSHF